MLQMAMFTTTRGATNLITGRMAHRMQRVQLAKYSAVQSQKAITGYLTSNQLLSSGFAEPSQSTMDNRW